MVDTEALGVCERCYPGLGGQFKARTDGLLCRDGMETEEEEGEDDLVPLLGTNSRKTRQVAWRQLMRRVLILRRRRATLFFLLVAAKFM